MTKVSRVQSPESRAGIAGRNSEVGSRRAAIPTSEFRPPTSQHSTLDSGPKTRRSAWRQRLVDAERGISLGFRLDSTFYGHFFIVSIVLATAVVLGIGLLEWTVVVLALTLVLSAEMFNQVLKVIWQTLGHHFAEPARRTLRIGTGAVFVTILGSVIAIGLIFGRRLLAMLAG